MPIILRLDRVMADRKISLNELSAGVGISNVNMSRIKTGKIKAIRFSTLEMICVILECQPGDILEFKAEKASAVDIVVGEEGFDSAQGFDSVEDSVSPDDLIVPRVR